MHSLRHSSSPGKRKCRPSPRSRAAARTSAWRSPRHRSGSTRVFQGAWPRVQRANVSQTNPVGGPQMPAMASLSCVRLRRARLADPTMAYSSSTTIIFECTYVPGLHCGVPRKNTPTLLAPNGLSGAMNARRRNCVWNPRNVTVLVRNQDDDDEFRVVLKGCHQRLADFHAHQILVLDINELACLGDGLEDHREDRSFAIRGEGIAAGNTGMPGCWVAVAVGPSDLHVDLACRPQANRRFGRVVGQANAMGRWACRRAGRYRDDPSSARERSSAGHGQRDP